MVSTINFRPNPERLSTSFKNWFRDTLGLSILLKCCKRTIAQLKADLRITGTDEVRPYACSK